MSGTPSSGQTSYTASTLPAHADGTPAFSSFFKMLGLTQNAYNPPAAQYNARPSVNPYTPAYTPNRGAPQQNTPQMTNPYVMQRQIDNPYVQQSQAPSPYRTQQQPQMPRSTTPNNVPQFGLQQIINYIAQARQTQNMPQSTPNLYRPTIDTANLGRVLPMYVPPPPAPPAPPGGDSGGDGGGDAGDAGGSSDGEGEGEGTSNASTDATDADAASSAASADASGVGAGDGGAGEGAGQGAAGEGGSSGGDSGDGEAAGGLMFLKKHKKIKKATGGLLDLKNRITQIESKRK